MNDQASAGPIRDHVIIVDDEQRMCESLAALLTDDGYRVDSYQRADEAAEAIRSGRVDLVVSDIKMPQMSGIELLRIVKEVDEEIPVILMTGYASLETAVEAVSQGAYDYLMKPIEFTALEMAIRRGLERRRSAIERRQLMERLKIATLLQERRIKELNALYEAGKSIGSTANLQELLKQIVSLASAVTESRVGSIMLLDEKGEFLTIEAATGLEQDVVHNTVVPVGSSIAGYVAQTGQPLKIDDVEKDERFRRTNRERYGGASLLCAPLIIKSKVIGVINMANRESGGTFGDNDLRLLVTFAAQAAVAVDDANQFEKSRRRLVEFEVLHEVSKELPQIKSLPEFRSVLVEKLQRLFPVDYSLWFNWDGQHHILELTGATGGVDLPLTDSGSIDLQAVSRDRVRLTNLDLNQPNLDQVEALSEMIAQELRSGGHFPEPGRAFMAIPISRQGELSHVFCLSADAAKPYSADDISLSRLVVSQAALLFEREQSLLNSTRLLTMGNMISEISHDLRKPLTSIKGCLQIVRKRWPDLQGSDVISMVDSEISRMNELVRELVDFSNPKKYVTEKVDLREIVKRSSELIRPDLHKHKIQFSSEFQAANWEIVINRNQIVEVLLNLFLNALDAMPDGGELTVTGLIEQPEHKKEPYLALKISDTGQGISKKNMSKIFDRYFTSKETGTGLGLAVVERIVSAHNGTLAVSSQVNKGSTFTIYFPYHG
ncbi:MAG: response regulator [bacterium]